MSSKGQLERFADAVLGWVGDRYLHAKDLYNYPEVAALCKDKQHCSIQLADAYRIGLLGRISSPDPESRAVFAYGLPGPKAEGPKYPARGKKPKPAPANPAPAKVIRPAPVEERPLVTKPVVEHKPIVRETQTPEPVVSGVESLARLIGRRIARAMMEAMQAEVEEQLQAMQHGLIERWAEAAVAPAIRKAEAVTAKHRLPRVLIVGPWPALFAQVKQEFDDAFDLELVGPDESLHLLKDKAKRADHVLVMTSKISHRHSDALAAAGVKPIDFGGGLSAMRDILTRLFVERKEVK